MPISPVNISRISMPRRFVNALANKSLIPLILVECFVTGGRTYNSYKRGGFTEARERFFEEFLGAVFWFSAIPMFDKLIDLLVGKKLLKLPETSFDVGKDNARDPIGNYLEKFRNKFRNPEKAESMLAKYRVGKIVSAVVLANLLVGCVVPKINQAITAKMLAKKKSENNSEKQPVQNITMDSFIQNSGQKGLSFKGIQTTSLLNFVHNFETNPRYTLLSEDGGIAAGRAASARNKYESIEILFRDITSTYFYMFNMPVVAMTLNKLEHGKSNRLDSVMADVTSNHLKELLNENNGTMSVEEFAKRAMGVKSERYRITPELEKVFENNSGKIKLNEFLRMFPEIDSNVAQRMAELQPKLKGESILTKAQVENLFVKGTINTPEFMHDLYTTATSKDLLFKIKAPTYQDELSFVSEKSILEKKSEVEDFVKLIIKKAKKSGGKVTKELINQVNRNNLRLNAFNWISGFAISALFLSTFIPKVQYWITKKLTGSDAFPGTAEYEKKDNSTNN